MAGSAASLATSSILKCAGYCYIRTLGPAGLRAMTENAVLNANYLLSLISPALDVPNGNRCMHEFVASASKLRRTRRISAMEIAKRLLDFGYHAPDRLFPAGGARGADD